MTTMIIHGSPVDPYFCIHVVEDTIVKETKETTINNLKDVIFNMITKYDIKHIAFSGHKSYMKGIQEQLSTGNEWYSLYTLTYEFI